MQIDAAVIAEPGCSFSGARVNRVKILIDSDEQPPLVALGPIRQPPVPLLASYLLSPTRIEIPQQPPGSGIERDNTQARRGRVKNAVDHDRVALHLGAVILIVRIKPPEQLQFMNVAAVDLIERRVPNSVLAARYHTPVSILRGLGQGG